jgi:hypothetical protein
VFSKFPFAPLTRCFLGIIYLLGPSYSAAQQAPSAIAGTVINSVTREPVPRALVELYANIAALTDDEGRFEFRLQQADTLSGQLTIRKPGFADTSYTYSYSPDAPNPDLVVPLLPESLIVGRVNLPTSNQSDRISVTLYQRMVNQGRVQWMNASSTQARSNGDFRFAALAPGTYKLFTEELADRDPLVFDPEGQHYGYPPIYFPTAQDFASAAPIQLEAGQTFHAELSPVLRPYFPVKIPITNLPSAEFPEISVAVQGHPGPGFALGFDDNAILGELPNGVYTVQGLFNNGNPQQSGSGSVQLTVNSSPSTATMAVTPHSSVAVHVRTEFSERAMNRSSTSYNNGRGETFTRSEAAQIYLQPADEFRPNQIISLRAPRRNNDNELAFENVPPGRYWVNVQPNSGYVASITSGGLDLLHDPFPLGEGGTDPIEIVLRDDAAGVEGTVDGMPASFATTSASNSSRTYSTSIEKRHTSITIGGNSSGAWLYAIPSPERSGALPTGVVSPDGTFGFSNLAPGTYRILAFDHQQDHLDYRNPDAMRAFEDKGPIVHLAPNQTEHIHLTLIHTTD